MKEPFSLRVSDETDPRRGAKFKAILDRKGAEASKVMRRLIDAYIASGGEVDFPVRLVAEEPATVVAVRRVHGVDGDGALKLIDPLPVEERKRAAASKRPKKKSP